MKLSIIIPAYNEEDGVAITVKAITPVMDKLAENYEVEVVFVNDGSKDDTANLLTEHTAHDERFKVVSYENNKGLGGAIRTGFRNVTGDIVVTTDFDGTYDFSDIEVIVKQLIDEKTDIVTASPYHKDGGVEGVPAYRLTFSYGASTLYRILVNPKIKTWTALFRAYRRTVIENVAFESNDFLAGTELLVRAIQKGYSVSEFPTILGCRAFGASSIRLYRVTKAHLTFQAELLKEYAMNLVPKIRFADVQIEEKTV